MGQSDVDAMRSWLRENFSPDENLAPTPMEVYDAIVQAGMDQKRIPGHDSGWMYELALTLVPFFPDIVASVVDNDEVEFQITFDWGAVEKVVRSILCEALTRFAQEEGHG